MQKFLNVVAAASAVLSLASLAVPALAQSYPAKPVRMILPFPPGGGNDIVGRIVAQKLAEGLKQTVVVDNRGGAGGTIGTDMTAKAPADGHTMLVNNFSLAGASREKVVTPAQAGSEFFSATERLLPACAGMTAVFSQFSVHSVSSVAGF